MVLNEALSDLPDVRVQSCQPRVTPQRRYSARLNVDALSDDEAAVLDMPALLPE